MGLPWIGRWRPERRKRLLQVQVGQEWRRQNQSLENIVRRQKMNLVFFQITIFSFQSWWWLSLSYQAPSLTSSLGHRLSFPLRRIKHHIPLCEWSLWGKRNSANANLPILPLSFILFHSQCARSRRWHSWVLIGSKGQVTLFAVGFIVFLVESSVFFCVCNGTREPCRMRRLSPAAGKWS